MVDWKVGASASVTRTFTETDVSAFACLSGDANPLHLDDKYARSTRFGQRLVHGLLTASLVSTVVGTRLPGRGAIYAGQTLRFVRPVFIGDTITVTAILTSYDRQRGRLILDTTGSNQHGETVLTGEADVLYRPSDETT